jgi:hypothetical protein
MTEEQLEALISLMQAVAYKEAGSATHQPRCKGIVEDAADEVRMAFDMPLVDREDNE